VLGVALGGHARAYPVAVLVFREMMNDELAGIPHARHLATGLLHRSRARPAHKWGGPDLRERGFPLHERHDLVDHETGSTWAQPWGRAIVGPLKDLQLHLRPSELTTWSAWKQAHPETLALINDVEGLIGRRQDFGPDFVIGLVLARGQSLTFRMQDGPLTDAEAGSAWDPVRVLAASGPLAGEALQPVPGLSSCDWAWSDFYLVPHSSCSERALDEPLMLPPQRRENPAIPPGGEPHVLA